MFEKNDPVSWTRYNDKIIPYRAVGKVASNLGSSIVVREDETGNIDEIIAERLTAINPEDGALIASIQQIRALLPDVPGGPWFASEVSENDDGSDSVTVGPHPAPHYEDMIAEFFCGNFSPAVPEVVVLVMNNLEALLKAAERSTR